MSNHCIANRLVLACGNEIGYLKRFKDLLDPYYEKSAVHMDGPKAIPEVLNDPKLKREGCEMALS